MPFGKNTRDGCKLWGTWRNQVRSWLVYGSRWLFSEICNSKIKAGMIQQHGGKWRPGDGNWIVKLEAKSVFNWKIKRRMIFIFGCVFSDQHLGKQWMKCSFCTLSTVALITKGWISFWLDFLTAPGRSDHFYAITPCKTNGLNRGWEKAMFIIPILASRSMSNSADKLWPLGAPGGIVSLNNLHSRPEPCRYKLTLNTVEQTFG